MSLLNSETYPEHLRSSTTDDDEAFLYHSYLYRHADGICGFSANSAVEVTVNIISQEIRRALNQTLAYPEHPRSSTTDDDEALHVCYPRRKLDTVPEQ